MEELEKYVGKYAVEVLKENGVKELFPPQKEALSLIMSEKNVLLCMPTASGKTLLAEIAMLRKAIEGYKSLYVSPLKAIANEKFKDFKKWEKIGLKIGISTGDYSSTDEHLKDCDIIVTTYEKADSLIRNRAKWLKDVKCLVVDEIHLIDDFERGDKVEMLVAKMLDKARIIALSATIKNYEEIAEWLKAEYYYSEWRPVPLLEGYYLNGYLYLDKVERKRFIEMVEEGTLIFEPTRKNAESTALTLAEIGFNDCEDLAKKVVEENDGEMSKRLAKCVSRGVAFHHAGLLPYQREIVEEGFRKNKIKVVVATPTLAAGVNLPAKKVIIRSLYRYDEGFSKPMKVFEYKQMVGRAGRPGCDLGVSVVFVSSKKIAEKYIYGEIEPVTSKLAVESKLRFHTLSLICESYSNLEELDKFFEKTLFRKQRSESLKGLVESVVYSLENWKMVKFNDKIVPTELGKLVCKLYIDPLTGSLFHENLRRKELSELGILHLICVAPDMEKINLRSDDDWVEFEARKYRRELLYYPKEDIDYEWFLREVKTALCLRDWINEIDEEKICKKYSIAPGDLRRIVETVEWLSSSLEKIANYLNLNKNINISVRIKYGVKEELLDLVKLYGIGRVRARKLFNAGIKNREDLVKNRELAEKIVGQKVVENALSLSKQ